LPGGREVSTTVLEDKGANSRRVPLIDSGHPLAQIYALILAARFHRKKQIGYENKDSIQNINDGGKNGGVNHE
jgi:hypothetical protein